MFAEVWRDVTLEVDQKCFINLKVRDVTGSLPGATPEVNGKSFICLESP